MLNHKISRHQIREKAVQTIFQLLEPSESLTIEAAINFSLEAGNDPEAGFDNVSDDYLNTIVNGVVEQRDAIDATIDSFLSKDWSLNRIAKIDLAILRLAIYEMVYVDDQQVPNIVALNEAIELAKTFSDDKSRTFINGILNKVLESLNA